MPVALLPERMGEWIDGRFTRNQPLFTGTRRRMTSVAVRGDQMAEEMAGKCLRCRYLTEASVATSPALVWIVEADLDMVRRFWDHTPQFLDVVNPAYEADRERFAPQYRAFHNLILNTESSRHYLGDEPDHGWRTWVIPHHHCNRTGWFLPESRVERPRTVGYVGEPGHLHDHDAIASAIAKTGMELICVGPYDLDAYRRMDIGIAWTRRETQRDLTRSNIKLSNFAAHGIPSVVCDYESYREVDQATGGSAIIAGTLEEFIDGIYRMANDEELRRQHSANGPIAYDLYSRRAVAEQYRQAFVEARANVTKTPVAVLA